VSAEAMLASESMTVTINRFTKPPGSGCTDFP
jgi:hypothetical protein